MFWLILVWFVYFFQKMFRISILLSVQAEHSEILFIFYCIVISDPQSEFDYIF